MGDSQEHRRHQAIARYLAGDSIEAICRDLHCAKSWLYKWRLLLDSRVVDWPMAYNSTFIILSSLKSLFFHSLKNES